MHHTCAVPVLPGGAFTCGRALRLGACAPHAHAPAFLGARYPCRETRGRASPQTNRYYDGSISAVGPADTELGGRGRALHRLWRRREGQAPAGGHLAVARAHSAAAPSRCRYEFHTQVRVLTMRDVGRLRGGRSQILRPRRRSRSRIWFSSSSAAPL